MERFIVGKSSYWEVAKYVSEEARSGRTLTEIANELSVKLDTASKFKTAYEKYHLEYGISLEKLEKTSVYDLYQAQSKAFKLVKDSASAKKLVDSLLSGDEFNAIRKAAKLAPKLKNERLLEAVIKRVKQEKVSEDKKSRKDEIIRMLTYYKTSIAEYRNEPTSVKADSLLARCISELAQLYIDS